MTPRIGSACSGYGGLEMGLMAVVGGSVAWHVEYDKHPSAVLEARFPGVPNYGDVTTTDWTQVEPVDWFCAGYPCQPFSHAGKRKGSADERHLWPAVADAIGVLRPGRVLLENVAGHVSLGLDAVLADLAALGYDATWGVVRAADAGAPHNRARIFIVAADTTSSKGSVGHGDDVRARWAANGCGTSARRSATADADDGGSRPRRAGSDGRREPVDSMGARQSAPDAASDGRDEGWTEPAGLVGRPDAAECGDAADADSHGGRREVIAELHGDAAQDPADRHPRGRHLDGCSDAPADAEGEGRDRRGSRSGQATDGAVLNQQHLDESPVAWGAYGAAIHRWEAVTGRPAPRPTEPGRTGERLSPRFVEWMMGLPVGHVTDVLPRNPALKALGNGVVPQQAALAVRALLSLESVAA